MRSLPVTARPQARTVGRLPTSPAPCRGRSALPRPAAPLPRRACVAAPPCPARTLKPAAAASDDAGSIQASLKKSIPTALTLARVAAVPALAAAWFAAPPETLPALATALFSAAAITDFFDGALARAWDACSPFGAFLDPVADKLMVCTAVVLLAARSGPGLAPAWWGPAAAWMLPAAAAAIIGREVAMSALREWAASLGGKARAAVAVSWAGKAKTAAQMVAVAVLLATSGGGGGGGWPAAVRGALEAAAPVGPPLLLASAGLGLVSLAQYVQALWPWLSGREKG